MEKKDLPIYTAVLKINRSEFGVLQLSETNSYWYVYGEFAIFMWASRTIILRFPEWYEVGLR